MLRWSVSGCVLSLIVTGGCDGSSDGLQQAAEWSECRSSRASKQHKRNVAFSTTYQLPLCPGS